MSKKKLHRSDKNKVFAGVCAGLAEYLGVDAVIIRILFVVLVILDFRFILVYLALAIIMPREKGGKVPVDEERNRKNFSVRFGNLRSFNLVDEIRITTQFLLV